jgi:hypothetical protein
MLSNRACSTRLALHEDQTKVRLQQAARMSIPRAPNRGWRRRKGVVLPIETVIDLRVVPTIEPKLIEPPKPPADGFALPG